ncbi:MAG: Ribosome-recycling factor [Legionellaceae bacterium]
MTVAIKNDTQTRMQKAIEVLNHEFSKIRSGRAHPALLDQIKVAYFGNETPLPQLASVTISDSRTLVVTAWDKNSIAAIDKAILNSGLGLNPTTAGTVIRVPLPPLTEERRKEMIKLVKGETENTKVAIRNVRRDANNALKELLKKKEISEDEERRAQDEIQKITDKFIQDAEKTFAVKEKELMEI